MNTITLHFPRTVICGNAAFMRLPQILSTHQIQRIFILTSSAVKTAHSDKIQQLNEAGFELEIGPSIDREPAIADFKSALLECERFAPDCVLGLGGGSVLDVAKLVAATAGKQIDTASMFGTDTIHGRSIMLVCVPTTAGTGSEASPNAILIDEQENTKKAVISRWLVPDIAVLDPVLTVSVPPVVTAATGMDALTHCLEAYTNRFAHPLTDTLAVAGVKLIVRALSKAVKDGSDIGARADLLLGSFYGGLCLGPVGTAAVHALAYPLGSRFGIGHGLANAVLLPHVMRFNREACRDRLAHLAVTLGITEAGTPDQMADAVVESIAELMWQLPLPARLRELGVPESALPELARGAMQITRLLKNNPRPVDYHDAVQIYSAAY